jgi:hypothetical protein
MRSWWLERQQLAALGVKDVDRLTALLTKAAESGSTRRRSRDPEERARQIAAFVAAAGGG